MCLWGCGFDAPSVPGAGDGAPPPDSALPADAGPPDAFCGAACNFARRRLLTLDSTGIDTELLNIPVLIKLDPTRIDYEVAQDNGGDLRFVTTDLMNELAYEIESWEQGGTSFVWLKVPRLPPESEGQPFTVFMYYGNANAQPWPAPSEVWENGFVSVHHLHGNMLDATGTGHDGSSQKPPTPGVGRVGGGHVFDGDEDYIELPGEADYDFVQSLSVSLWFQVRQFDRDWQALVAKGDSSWRVHRYDNDRILSFSTDSAGAFPHNGSGRSNVDNGNWHHVLVSYDGAQKRMYIDGQLDYQSPYSQRLYNTDFPVHIGENSDVRGRYFDGAIDEVRIADVPRPAAWVLAEYRSVTDDGFVTFGAEEALGAR